MRKLRSPDQIQRMPVMAAGNVDADLCFVVQRANRTISRGADTALRTVGVTAGQTLLMAAIAEAGSPRSADLSLALDLDPSTITANLKPLMAQGLILTSVDVSD